MESIPVLVADTQSVESAKGLFSTRAGARVLRLVPIERLQANLAELSEGLARATSTCRATGSLVLKEVEVQLEVSAEGGVSLIGTATIGGTSSLTLRFAQTVAD
jgi:hypothetical protein